MCEFNSEHNDSSRFRDCREDGLYPLLGESARLVMDSRGPPQLGAFGSEFGRLDVHSSQPSRLGEARLDVHSSQPSRLGEARLDVHRPPPPDTGRPPPDTDRPDAGGPPTRGGHARDRAGRPETRRSYRPVTRTTTAMLPTIPVTNLIRNIHRQKRLKRRFLFCRLLPYGPGHVSTGQNWLFVH